MNCIIIYKGLPQSHRGKEATWDRDSGSKGSHNPHKVEERNGVQFKGKCCHDTKTNWVCLVVTALVPRAQLCHGGDGEKLGFQYLLI